ncbi:MAG: 30S ribosomal protein S11 [Candidatus Dojkabacteria bacterium]
MAKKAVKQNKTKTGRVKKAKKVSSPVGHAYVSSTYNNTIISVTDINGAVIANSSPGIIGYKGSKKSTAYAATKAGEDAAEKALKSGLKEIRVFVKGLGQGRNGGVKGLRSGGLKITGIVDMTPIPHGGPTPRKAPRGS